MILRIQATVQSLTASAAVLELEDGQVLTVSLRNLATRPAVGQVCTITVLPEAEAVLETEELARTLLNQLVADVPPPTSQEGT
jgi:hypothetical protein